MKSDIRFCPVTTGRRASEDVALQIEAAILDGKIKPGERLPSERALQVQFNTGRGVVREALQVLRQKSLIEIKKGARGGAYIKQVEVSHVGEALALFIKQQPLSPKHLIEFRESLDRTIATLASARATREEKQALLDKALEFKRILGQEEPDMHQVGEMDRTLNLMVAKMTGNPIIEWVMQALQLGFSSHDLGLYERDAYGKKTAGNWCDTARAIYDDEPLQALSFISFHYAMLMQILNQTETAASSDALKGST